MNSWRASASQSLPGPDDITRIVLANGIVVLCRANFSSQSVVISGYLDCGSLSDPDQKLGLADFTAQALMRGTERHTFQQIYDMLEEAGASLGFGASVHTTSFNGRSLAEDLPMLLGLLAETVQEPAFPPEQIERLRAQLLTGLAVRAQDTRDMASLTFDQLLYEGHPYSRPEDGFTETIQAITREDLIDFHRRNYGPRGMVIVIVGAVEPKRAVDLAAEALGAWQNPLQEKTPPLPPYKPPLQSVSRHVLIPGKSQADLVMGGPGPERRSADYMAASLGNNILGQFGMYGRIGDVVREQSGLAYYAYSSLNAGIGPGSWEVSAGVNPANLGKTIELIQQEIRRFVTEPVTPEELADSQANYIGRLPLMLESNAGMAGALLNLERYDLGLDYYRRYASLVREVTPEWVLEVAQRYLNPDTLVVATAGPQEG